jgi:hypothetical protein
LTEFRLTRDIERLTEFRLTRDIERLTEFRYHMHPQFNINFKHTALKYINPDNIVLKNTDLSHSRLKKSKKKCKESREIFTNRTHEFSLSKKYIQLFDSYGEICLQNTFYL